MDMSEKEEMDFEFETTRNKSKSPLHYEQKSISMQAEGNSWLICDLRYF